MARIAVDAMGGDHAPATVVEGALQAADKHSDLEVILVGVKEAIEEELRSQGAPPDRFEIVHASEVVAMHEGPVEALRRKPDSSLRVMTALLKSRECDAVFSAGNTGAMVAAATMLLGLLPGVKRAGIAVTFPVGDRPVVLIDAGANVQPKPEHLFQYGIMAAEMTRGLYQIEDPTIGLLNVGEEEQKGNPLVKETRELFRGSDLRYLGHVEGGDIFTGDCDVVVCDGFVGNIVLKVSEGLAERIMTMVFEGLGAATGGGGGPTTDAIRALSARLDYAAYGGAPLLGVDGIAIIGHGRSHGRAIANALSWARQTQESHVNDHILEAISRGAK